MDANIQTSKKLVKRDKMRIDKKIYKIVKRIIDIIGALIGCVILIPLTFVIWLVNLCSNDNGPVFYTQKRIGKNGKEFKILKFRTMCNKAQEMVKDEETMKKYFTEDQIKEWKENFKIDDDPRITKLGKILRKTSLDEFPQIINILKGELSLIGPRPVIEEELEKYENNKEKFLSVKPGLTGYWAANGRSDTSYEERMAMELYYVDNISFKLDIEIFFKTFVTVLKREGAK
jgi:lipopolysaccharide/colanic/teichoic acid biosynthesis glycosyltransferase